MLASVELQIVSKILTTEDPEIEDTLCAFDTSYYSVYTDQIKFILDHRDNYQKTPDIFTFQAKFPSIELVSVDEPLDYLVREIKRNKQHILLIEMVNKLTDLGSSDISEAWQFIGLQHDKALSLDDSRPSNIIRDAEERSKQIIEFSKQDRIPTGFKELDELMYGGFSTVEELVIVLARTNAGKAQPLWSKVLTPSGWKKMGDIEIGDTVVGHNNDNGKVVEIFPQGVIDYYKVHFDDGTYVECCDDHLWTVLNKESRKRDRSSYSIEEVLTTKEIRENLHNKYSTDISEVIEFDVPFDETQEIDPYLLGVIIGDGGLRDSGIVITNENDDIWTRVKLALARHNCKVSGKHNDRITGVEFNNNFVLNKLREYGLMGNKSIDKFIPKQYLTAPVHVRKALLAGLVDTDGYIPKNSTVWDFDTASDQLAEDFAELARSLGIRVTLYDRKDSYYIKDGKHIPANGTRHLYCRSTFNPFYAKVKSDRYKEMSNRAKRHCKIITNVEYAGKTECQCILLDNNTHTYITDGFTTTHNSWVSTRIMESAQSHGFPVLYYSPEMQSSMLATRFDTWRDHFVNSDIFRGIYDERYKEYIKKLPEEQTGAYIVEDKDMPDGVSARSLSVLVKRYGIKLLIIDGLSYMNDDKKSSRDYDKYKNICHDLFDLSKQYGCAVFITMQANRATKDERTTDEEEPFPTIYNAEGSDHPSRIATQVFAIRQVRDKKRLDIRLEKARNARNAKTVLSYTWDVNTGTVEYIPDDDVQDMQNIEVPKVAINVPTNPAMENIEEMFFGNSDNYEEDDDSIIF